MVIAAVLIAVPAPPARAGGAGDCASGVSLCIRVVSDAGPGVGYGVATADLPGLSDAGALAGQRLSICLSGSPATPLDSPTDLASIAVAVAGLKPSQLRFVSIARPSGGGYAVLDGDDLTDPDFLHREGCSDRPLVFLDGGRISYLRPQRTPGEDNSLDYLSTEGTEKSLVVVVHTSGALVTPQFTTTGDLAAGSPVTIGTSNLATQSGWDFEWSCAHAADEQARTSVAVTCTWAEGGSFFVVLTAHRSDGSLAYGSLPVTVGPALPSPSPGTSNTATNGPTAGTPTGGGKSTSTTRATATATATGTAGATPSATSRVTAGASEPAPTPSPTPSPSRAPTPTPTPTPTADLRTGYLLSADGVAGAEAAPAAALPARSGGAWVGIPPWVLGVAALVAAMLAGAAAETAWRVPARRRAHAPAEGKDAGD